MTFAAHIIEWYHRHKRPLPWRETNDPYKIWLSEIILQQTRVAQGLPYYLRFVDKYPHVKALAEAPVQEVLRLWQGLGYYSRARNLHKCAQMVCLQWNGKFPTSYQDLLRLPGVGGYTAAAIASFAYREPVAVLDGNVYRVLARIFGIETDISSAEAKTIFLDKANDLIDKEEPDHFNQAMMEFGATWCTPKNPNCVSCPFQRQCVAWQQGMVNLLPVKSKKVKVRHRYIYYLVPEWKGKIAMRKRDKKDIWQGLYDFECIEMPRLAQARKVLRQQFPELENEEVLFVSEPVKHVLTHQLLTIWFCHIQPKKKWPGTYYSSAQVQQMPKPIVITRYLEANGFIKSS